MNHPPLGVGSVNIAQNGGAQMIDETLELELATAIQADQSVITEEGLRYVDNEQGEEKIVPFTEVIDLPEADDESNSDETPDNQ